MSQSPQSPPFLSLFRSERFPAIVLLVAAAAGLAVANSPAGPAVDDFMHVYIGIPEFFELSVSHWIKDGLLALFFFVVAVELQFELTSGQLNSAKKALQPAIAAAGGVIVPPDGYFPAMVEVCRRYDVLFVADEVVTAWGRIGHWFASEDVFGIQPDIITCAKGLTSGYVPMGAAIISDRLIADVTGKDATFSNGYTYSGHPVSAAAGLKSMEIIEREGILEHVQKMAPIFQNRLQELQSIDIVSDTRGLGLMGCVQCSEHGEARGDLDLDTQIGAMIDAECQKRGLILRPVINMCVFSPPLIIKEAEIHQMFDILQAGIKTTMKSRRVAGTE